MNFWKLFRGLFIYWIQFITNKALEGIMLSNINHNKQIF